MPAIATVTIYLHWPPWASQHRKDCFYFLFRRSRWPSQVLFHVAVADSFAYKLCQCKQSKKTQSQNSIKLDIISICNIVHFCLLLHNLVHYHRFSFIITHFCLNYGICFCKIWFISIKFNHTHGTGFQYWIISLVN